MIEQEMDRVTTTPSLVDSELILDADGRIYHLRLLAEDIADTIIFVGDPERVPKVSQYFDSIEFTMQAREFVTHTGYLNKKRLTVLSTGMSTGNIDIVMTELDALVNIDMQTKQIKPQKRALNIIRLGTSGNLQKNIPIDSILVSTHALGLDNLLHYYDYPQSPQEQQLMQQINTSVGESSWMTPPYLVQGSASLVDLLHSGCERGITVTAPGFYAPQNRHVRARPKAAALINKLSQFHWQDHRITNFEMETSGIYGLGRVLGHNCCSVSALVANRANGEFSRDPHKTIDRMIRTMLERIVTVDG